MRVLLDADALIGLYLPSDFHHEKARKRLTQLIDDKSSLYVSNLVLQEAATVLSHKVGQSLARKFLVKVRSLGAEKIYIDERMEHLTWRLFIQQTKKGTSFVDCNNVVVYKNLKLDGIFSFDKFYKKVGVEMIG